MLITFSDYSGLNYTAVSAMEFPRFEAMARKTVDKHCFGRVTAYDITEDNIRGMCELIDLFYFDANPQESADAKLVTSFSNEGYSESYAPGKQVLSLQSRITDIMSLYFTPAQLFRGVG